MSDILNIGSSIKRDDSIVRKQYHTYTPYVQSYNNNDEVRIAIQSQDLYVLPSESYIYMEIAVARQAAPAVAGVAAAAEPAVRFIYNFIPHFFSEIRYELNGYEIDRCKNPGITSTMKRLAAQRQRNIHNLTTTYDDANIAVRTYGLILPLSDVLGFADDYRRVVINAKHELILVRSRNDVNTILGEAAANGLIGITIRKIQWKIPHIQLADHSKLKMLKMLEQKHTISIPFRSWDLYEIPQLPAATKHIWSVKTTTQLTKPRYVIVGLQTNRNNNLVADSSGFDHCDISDVKLYMNNEYYPYDNYNSNFDEGNFQDLLFAFLNIQNTYYYGTEKTNQAGLTANVFLSRPLFAFDCTRNDESLMNSTVDVRVEINARENIPANTAAYCLIIHDNIVTYSPFEGTVIKSI